MSTIINLDKKRQDDFLNKRLDKNLSRDEVLKIINIYHLTLEQNIQNILSAKSSMQDAVNYIYEQFAKSGLDKIELDINTHDINLTINDLDKDFLDNLDFAITLCAEEICPVLPTDAISLHWINEDPAMNNLNDVQLNMAFQKTRENIYNLMKKFMIENNL